MHTEAREIFADYIRARGLKDTPQRNLILRTFLNTERHLSAEDLLNLINRRNKRVGFATVYRTMKLISDCGLAREVTFDDGVSRFEHLHEDYHHHHLFCTECKKVFEFTSPVIDREEKRIIDKFGFEARSHNFKIFGVCKACREARAK